MSLLSSCSSEKNISEFEKIMGKENSLTLTSLLSDFENEFLKKQYPESNLNQCYINFLTDYKNGTTENWIPLSNKILDRFRGSDLENEIYYYPDSVWILPNSNYDKVEEDSLIFLDIDRPYIKLRKKNLMFSEPDNTIYEYERHYIYIDSTMSRDSIIEKFMNRKMFNAHDGKYIIATNHIRKLGGFFEHFSDRKGIMSNEMFCDLVLNEADLNDQLVRKLILLELVL